jgi:hypothetical protein
MLRALLLTTPLLLIAAAPPADKSDVGKDCMNHGVDYATGQPNPDGFRRLDQLPPANEILTVIHSVDGCQKPVIVRYNIGGNPSLAK